MRQEIKFYNGNSQVSSIEECTSAIVSQTMTTQEFKDWVKEQEFISDADKKLWTDPTIAFTSKEIKVHDRVVYPANRPDGYEYIVRDISNTLVTIEHMTPIAINKKTIVCNLTDIKPW